MPESYVQVPVDGAGKKLRHRERTVASQTVYEQFMVMGALPTYNIWTGALAFAANKHFLTLYNTGTDPIRVRKLFLQNTHLTAVTGVGVQFRIGRITAAPTGGTAITPVPADSADGALSGLTVVHTTTTATITSTLFDWFTNNDEVVPASPMFTWQNGVNILPEGPEVKELTLRTNEGITVQNLTSTTVGSYGVLAVVTKGE
jgi:hypothetical protein